MISSLSQEILMDRYARNGENTVEDVFSRVAYEIGQTAKEKQQFYKAMESKKFIPAGRILAADKERTYYNCYVLPSPKDSREGIVTTLHQILEIQSRGGGIGVNISSLRPRGAIARKVGGASSGSVSWAGLYSYATGLIEQGGSRRGATMIILNDWHPDLLEFIDSKRESGQITNANISVGFSDAFMEAVKEDLEWNLVFPDTTYKDYDEIWDGDLENWRDKNLPVIHYETVRAKDVWNKVMHSAWSSAEPGLWFRDRANSLSNSWYYAKLICTNPCFTGDTLIHTEKGMFTAKELYEKGGDNSIVIDNRFGVGDISPASHVFSSGVKPVIKVQTKEGYSIKVTEDHKIMTPAGWEKAGNLSEGDKIHVLNHEGGFSENGSFAEGAVLGWLVGDGCITSEGIAFLDFHHNKRVLATEFNKWVYDIVDGLQYPNREYGSGYYENEERKFIRLGGVRLLRWAKSMGLEEKLSVPISVMQGSKEMQRGYLSALFSADGTVLVSNNRRNAIRLSSNSLALLSEVQALLTNFGVFSRIYENRIMVGERLMRDVDITFLHLSHQALTFHLPLFYFHRYERIHRN